MSLGENVDSAAETDPVTAEPDQIRAEIDRTRADLGETVTALSDKVNPRLRVRQAVTTAKTKATAGAAHVRTVAPRQARQAQQTVRDNPMPVAAGTLAVVAAVVALLVSRQRAAKAKAARNRWRPGFLQN